MQNISISTFISLVTPCCLACLPSYLQSRFFMFVPFVSLYTHFKMVKLGSEVTILQRNLNGMLSFFLFSLLYLRRLLPVTLPSPARHFTSLLLTRIHPPPFSPIHYLARYRYSFMYKKLSLGRFWPMLHKTETSLLRFMYMKLTLGRCRPMLRGLFTIAFCTCRVWIYSCVFWRKLRVI